MYCDVFAGRLGGTPVALKAFVAAGDATTDAVDAEVKLLMGLRHTNIVTVFGRVQASPVCDPEQHRRTRFMVMEAL
eukprot:CAMPEP_0174869832 /NCGR_PEP_ID=MMETSP1114-20130205/68594_1 /TAXON_ID=312471 /ORGANISM="Neobodo designis, Strain CCAP 1951/1" /LENGTH=75 /DNA_ID=CAMNT_0016105087 /DNA_START=24 /DNA_END=247 /DNA_ORIENTATION=+